MKPIGYILLVLLLAVLVYVSREHMTITVTDAPQPAGPPTWSGPAMPPPPPILSQPMPVPPSAIPMPPPPPPPPPFPVVSTADSPELVAAKANLASAQQRYDKAGAAYLVAQRSYKSNNDMTALNAARADNDAALEAAVAAQAEVNRLNSGPGYAVQQGK